MRIAYICADMGVPVFGRKGSSIHVQEIIRAFIRQGARVELFATRFDGGRPAGFDGVVIHRLPVPPKNSDGAARERAALEANRTLMDLLKREGSFDIVYERYSLWSYAGMEYARDIGMTGVLEVNAPLIEEQAQHRTYGSYEGRAGSRAGLWGRRDSDRCIQGNCSIPEALSRCGKTRTYRTQWGEP